MKLPTTQTGGVQAITPKTTVQGAAQAAGLSSELAKTAVDVGAEVYKGVSASSYTRAATNFQRQYNDEWGEFNKHPNIDVAALESQGISVNPDLVETVTDAEGNERSYVPTWAVASEYHDKLTSRLIDENTKSAKTDLARNRFNEEYTSKYKYEQQQAVTETALKQMRTYQTVQLNNDVAELVELENYNEAAAAISRAQAADTIDAPTAQKLYKDVRKTEEISAAVKIIEGGSIEEQQKLLKHYLQFEEEYGVPDQGPKGTGKRADYEGELTVPERQKFINQLKSNISAATKAREDNSDLTYIMGKFDKSLADGKPVDPEVFASFSEQVALRGNKALNLQLDDISASIMVFDDVMYSSAAVNEGKTTAINNSVTLSTRDVELAEKRDGYLAQKERLANADPVGLFNQYGPNTPVGDRASQNALAPTMEGVSFADVVEARQLTATEQQSFTGKKARVLTQAETSYLNNVFNTGTLAQKEQAMATIATAGADNARKVYAELEAVAEGDTMTFIAAGHMLGKPNGAVGANVLLQALASAHGPNADPAQKQHADSKQVAIEISNRFQGYSEVNGENAGGSFKQALRNTYAYLATKENADPKKVDAKIMDRAEKLVFGGSLTTIGTTRVRPPESIPTAEDFTFTLENLSGEDFEAKLSDYSFSGFTDIKGSGVSTDYVTGEGLKQSLRDGRARLVADKYGGYFVQAKTAWGLDVLVKDDSGKPITIDFDDQDLATARKRRETFRAVTGGRSLVGG